MKKAKYLRRRNIIQTVKTGKNEVFKFVAEAKRKSHQLQLAVDGALGRGSVQVVEKLPATITV